MSSSSKSSSNLKLSARRNSCTSSKVDMFGVVMGGKLASSHGAGLVKRSYPDTSTSCNGTDNIFVEMHSTIQVLSYVH